MNDEYLFIESIVRVLQTKWSVPVSWNSAGASNNPVAVCTTALNIKNDRIHIYVMHSCHKQNRPFELQLDSYPILYSMYEIGEFQRWKTKAVEQMQSKFHSKQRIELLALHSNSNFLVFTFWRFFLNLNEMSSWNNMYVHWMYLRFLPNICWPILKQIIYFNTYPILLLLALYIVSKNLLM